MSSAVLAELLAGQSFIPDGDGHALVLDSGQCEVYALTGTRRIFMGVVSAGTVIVPPDPAAGRLCMQALQDSRVLSLDEPTWLRARPEILTAAVEPWCLLLSSALGAFGVQRPALRPLPPGQSVEVEEDGAITAAYGVVWCAVSAPGPVTLLFRHAMPPGLLVPLGHQGWLGVPAGAEIRAFSTMDVVLNDHDEQRTTVPSALRALATAVVATAGALAEEAEAAEHQRISLRDAELEKTLGRNIGRFHRIFTDNTVSAPQDTDCSFVYRTLTRLAPTPQSLGSKTTDFEAFAGQNNARIRTIPLNGQWWRRDMGPLAATRRSDGKLVALRPDWLGRYCLHALGEAPRRVTAAIAADLRAEARIVTRPLPNMPLRVRDIIKDGLTLCAVDLGTLAVAMLAASALGLLLPIATGALVDTYIPASMRSPALIIGVGLLAAQICVSAINLTANTLRLRMDGRITEMVGGGLMDRVMRLPGALTRTMSSSDVSSRINAMDGIRRSAMGLVLNAMMSGISGISGIALLLFYSLPGGLIALGLVALLVAVGVATGFRQITAFTLGEQMTVSVSSFTLQIVENMPVLRAFAAERRAFARWTANSAEMRSRILRSKSVGNFFEAFLAAYQIVAVAVIFAVLGYSLGPQDSVSTGGYMVFVTTFQTFMAAGLIVARGANQAFNIKPQAQRVDPLLKNAPETPPQAKDPGAISGALEVNNVCFQHEAGKPILNGVSFRVSPGAFLALVGPSGSGKSTLMSLLVGFEQPSAGSIRYDGRDIAGLDLIKLRRQVGVVRQNGRLFAGSLRENIQGPHVADLKDVWCAAEQSGIADDIRAMPMGMHTVVTEGASAFSGGQIQRLLLARALMGTPKILLLDEATSALDNLTQAKVAHSIDSLGVTRIVIAHRLSTVRNADVILFMDQGRIVESGTYNELLEQGGAFARFARLQAL